VHIGQDDIGMPRNPHLTSGHELRSNKGSTSRGRRWARTPSLESL
jgi:hypothetical protein